ncbi:Hypothetical predicted protein [Paramuricea clavata]|uniref:Uncharacterized protein n=1 Tax=Paramuricea clavata TaxID=317549 RepID=A0A6S7FZB2_PARCT|nr:Hypothetical predicted protein [Paramuricea clavata]
MAELNDIINEFKTQPKEVVVKKLISSVETLTSMKLLLAEKCQAVQGFPKGELRSRRKPKGISTSSCLEERLSGDVAELINFLETEVVTSEIRNMFDNMAVTSVEEHHNTIQEEVSKKLVGLEDKIEELLKRGLSLILKIAKYYLAISIESIGGIVVTDVAVEGFLLAVKSSILSFRRDEIEPDAEILVCDLLPKDAKKLTICVCYRPPDYDDFIEPFASLLAKVNPDDNSRRF